MLENKCKVCAPVAASFAKPTPTSAFPAPRIVAPALVNDTGDITAADEDLAAKRAQYEQRRDLRELRHKEREAEAAKDSEKEVVVNQNKSWLGLVAAQVKAPVKQEIKVLGQAKKDNDETDAAKVLRIRQEKVAEIQRLKARRAEIIRATEKDEETWRANLYARAARREEEQLAQEMAELEMQDQEDKEWVVV
ncbi:uncharacterized protein LY89DRAFT_729994 [Mollisia scopiformis]|uniref:Uncharacterized protein n=1 Tax=Mollisia scopiformis TaxID=149040 RepID=A0A194XN64_MOLSC|nr:uncharacterized protein LY89DRAFT_729994 [Mollisia scopiformis]KUJ21202.1 hypothetical protein LY89DRAFT_729994 [Mollisia scopiformis]